VRHVGFISEEEKVAALGQCALLVMPSPFESLSVITLEAWKLGVPVLANARCKVLMGQCLRSNGGLFYHGYAEFAEGLRLLLGQDGLARRLGEQGRAYVDREYAWETIDARMESLFERTA
jgi:glycosyltransferase involved in cell wall biosynthesis